MEGERIKNERRKCKNFISLSLLETLYNNRKGKVKDIFDFGKNYIKVLPLLSTIQTSPNTFQFFQFSHFFLKFSSPIISQYNSTFAPIGFREIHTNLHKISTNTQIHLIYFYYRLHFEFRNHIRHHKYEGLTILPLKKIHSRIFKTIKHTSLKKLKVQPSHVLLKFPCSFVFTMMIPNDLHRRNFFRTKLSNLPIYYGYGFFYI